MMMGAAGAAGGEGLYADDVFSTYLYEGNGSTQTITNGIDLAGEGGLVWIKGRNDIFDHYLVDTERGVTKYLKTHTTAAEGTSSPTSNVTSFNSDGFSLAGSSNDTNNPNSKTYASWTFRKAPGFFDVVTYMGDGTSGQTVNHALDSIPGCIIIKRTDGAGLWFVYHRSADPNKYLRLDSTDAETNNGGPAFSAITSSSFTFDRTYYSDLNQSGLTYVAYLFAHDDQSFGTGGNESIIKCDQYVGAGSGTVKEIDLGFEPQWLMVKKSDGVENWMILDNMRGVSTDGNDAYLVPNEVDAEVSNADRIRFTPTGFQAYVGNMTNQLNANYIYVAIRRPNKPPEAATDVFAVTKDNNGSPYTVGFPTDAFLFNILGGNALNTTFMSRLTGGGKYLVSSSGDAEGSSGFAAFDLQNDFDQNISASSNIGYNLRRAPGFFDVVAYTGDGTFDGSYNVNHNLEVTPEFIIAKSRDSINNWNCYHKDLTSDTYLISLNLSSGETNTGQSWGPATTTFKPQYAGNSAFSSNHSGVNYIAYLFATLPGTSKVGSYAGTGSDINVDCGFTAGARFVLIKRTDSTGDWYVWDTARGIVSGNDPYFLLNSTAAEVTSTDYIDPLNAGFTVTSSAPAALNASGGTYIFLAIA